MKWEMKWGLLGIGKGEAERQKIGHSHGYSRKVVRSDENENLKMKPVNAKHEASKRVSKDAL